MRLNPASKVATCWAPRRRAMATMAASAKDRSAAPWFRNTSSVSEK
jgi:hypothetical protein